MDVTSLDTFVPRKFSSDDLLRILPHRGNALVIHEAEITGSENATGTFLLLADDVRVRDHFGIMPGVLMAEFAHLTAAVLVLAEQPGNVPILGNTRALFKESARIGDVLTCKVERTLQSKRQFGFTALVYKNDSPEPIATLEFSGSLLPKRVFERMA